MNKEKYFNHSLTVIVFLLIYSALGWYWVHVIEWLNTLRLRQNGRHFSDDIFKCMFLNENISVAITNSLAFVPKGPINNIAVLVLIMDWCCPGDKPLSEPMMVSLTIHICITRPQWVKNKQEVIAWKVQWCNIIALSLNELKLDCVCVFICYLSSINILPIQMIN